MNISRVQVQVTAGVFFYKCTKNNAASKIHLCFEIIVVFITLNVMK